HLDLDEHEREVVSVDHVVLDAGWPGVRDAGLQFGVALSGRLVEQKLAGSHRHDHILVLVPVIAGRSARCEAPFGNAHRVVVDLYRGLRGWHVAKASRKNKSDERLASLRQEHYGFSTLRATATDHSGAD